MRWCRRSVYLRSGKNRCSARYSTAYSSLSVRKPRPDCSGRGDVAGGRSVAVVLAAAGPDQAEGLAAFVIEEVGVDRRGEARIVELDREVIAALIGALRPGGADLCAADEDPVAWRVVAGPAGLRNDADAFGLDGEGADLALNSLPDFLKEPMVAMSFLLGCSSPRHRGLDGDRKAAGDRRPHPLGPEHSGGWRRRDFLASRGMGAAGDPALAGWQAQGKKVSPPPLRQGDRGLQSCGPITPSRGRARSRARQPCKEKTWQT